MIRNKLLLCLFCFLTCSIPGIVAYAAIVGGNIVKETNQFPYQVSVQVYGIHFCGGSIIGHEFILTTAHCFVKSNGKVDLYRTAILGGTHHLGRTEDAVHIDIKMLYVPEEYKSPATRSIGDIAVVWVVRMVFSDYLTKVKLPTNERENYAGKIATISGFGWSSINIDKNYVEHGEISKNLRYAEAQVLGNRHFQKYHEYVSEQDHICAQITQSHHHSSKSKHHAEVRGVCYKDSGGPLVIHDYQHNHATIIGVLSYGPVDCSEKNYYGVYTRVASYLGFINRAMNGTVKNMRVYEP